MKAVTEQKVSHIAPITLRLSEMNGKLLTANKNESLQITNLLYTAGY